MSALSGSYGWTDTLKSVQYGPGCTVTALPKLMHTLGVRKGLIVTGRSLYTKTDVVAKIKAILTALDAYAGVFTEIGEHTPVAGIDACIKVYNDSGADFIVAVGGGSPIDGAKNVRYRVMEQTGAAAPPPQIAIPTTLSAAEYSVRQRAAPVAGLTTRSRLMQAIQTTRASPSPHGLSSALTPLSGTKVVVEHQLLAPAGVILDAELTLATPSRLWISSGIRALDHSIGRHSTHTSPRTRPHSASESLYRPRVSHPGKILCYAALADLFTYLPISLRDPTNIEARQKLLVATWMSLWPTKWETANALGLSHALGHRLGATYGIAHGITSCLTLAPVVALQARIASPEDKACLARALFYLEEPGTGSVDGDVLKLSRLIAGLVETLGLTSTLSANNVPREDIPKLARGDVDVVQLLNGIY
ncbi:alcohol dehydrogenase IV [Mycena pura]|uniref:Alcohol dehydrogenase IV n=1 Tax=Mycena pura TaxID=153505 RepID=A0AAD7E5V3_9AGAR|nr:alcohol dehydrogenase IV [Mycena pura]